MTRNAKPLLCPSLTPMHSTARAVELERAGLRRNGFLVIVAIALKVAHYW
jgi:hypothetical protein